MTFQDLLKPLYNVTLLGAVDHKYQLHMNQRYCASPVKFFRHLYYRLISQTMLGIFNAIEMQLQRNFYPANVRLNEVGQTLHNGSMCLIQEYLQRNKEKQTTV